MRIETTTTHRAIIRMPSDLHHHFRDGNMLRITVPNAARSFRHVLAMPNLRGAPIQRQAELLQYHHRLHAALLADGPTNARTNFVMTLYLTSGLSHELVSEAFRVSFDVAGVKFYPRGLTTNADHGPPARDLYTPGTSAYGVLRELTCQQRVLLVHACDGADESGNELDPYDQERHFVQQTLPRIRDAHPDLKISLEHLSTGHGCDYVRQHGGPTLGCSLTPHHLGQSRRDVFRGGFRPHRFWWPVAQPEEHRQELLRLLREDRDHVWLGTDSAPHERGAKEASCCAGGVMLTHPVEMLAEIMIIDPASHDQWERLERFASINGPAWFGLSETPESHAVVLAQRPSTVLDFHDLPSGSTRDDDEVVPYRAGDTLAWTLEEAR